MDLKETGKKLKPFAPVLSVAVVASCVAGSLSGYQPPVYAAQEQTNSVKEETTKSEEQEQAVKGSFDLTDGVYKGTGTGYAGDITVAVQIKDRQMLWFISLWTFLVLIVPVLTRQFTIVKISKLKLPLKCSLLINVADLL